MNYRKGNLIYCWFLGAMAGFYLAVLVDMVFWGSIDLTQTLIWLPIIGGTISLWWLKRYFPPEPDVIHETISLAEPSEYCNLRDVAIDDAYTQVDQIDLIKERQYMIKTGRYRVPRGKNYGEAFKELMEGSDPLDT